MCYLYLFLLNVIDDRAILSIQPVSLFTPGHHSDLKSFDMRFIETYQLAYSHVPIARVARLRRIEGPVLSTLSSYLQAPHGHLQASKRPPFARTVESSTGGVGCQRSWRVLLFGHFLLHGFIYNYYTEFPSISTSSFTNSHHMQNIKTKPNTIRVCNCFMGHPILPINEYIREREVRSFRLRQPIAASVGRSHAHRHRLPQ